MGKIYITGHRNPDLDSLCAANSYAMLKNKIDPENEYIPVHCSPVSDSVRKQMEVFNLEIPAYKKDVRPKVGDVMHNANNLEGSFDTCDPIFNLTQTYSTDNPSVVPIFDGEKFKGLLSVDDITAWFLRDNSEEIPFYEFSIENISRVLPGHLVSVEKGEGGTSRITGSLLVGASSIESFSEFMEKYERCILITGMRKDIIEYAMSKQIPAIIITTADEMPDIDYSGYKGIVYITTLGTAETVRRLRLAETIGTMMMQETQCVDCEDRFEDVKSIFMTSHTRGLAVKRDGEFCGYVTRRCFLNMPSSDVIMVDHNEPNQSIDGIEMANVKEIIDHHRLDAVSTKYPIFIDAEPLGSTCTIVYQQYIRHGIMPDVYAAKMMLTGILSDTLILRSPTTTAADVMTVEMLAKIAKVDSIDSFGETLFSVIDNLANVDPIKSIQSDFKKYESAGVNFAIGQCEVMTLNNIDEYADKYLDALNTIKETEGLDWALLMITDVIKEKSVLLTSAYKGSKDLPYQELKDQMYDMPGVMSRKKQLLPTVISVTGRA